MGALVSELFGLGEIIAKRFSVWLTTATRREKVIAACALRANAKAKKIGTRLFRGSFIGKDGFSEKLLLDRLFPLEHVARIVFRPTVLGFAALSLWCAHGCLAPGSLENEGLYRIEGDAAPSSPSGDGQASGCAEACTTFHTTCATTGCHTANNPAAQLDLESPGVIKRMTCFSLAKSFESSEYAGDTGA